MESLSANQLCIIITTINVIIILMPKADNADDADDSDDSGADAGDADNNCICTAGLLPMVKLPSVAAT